MIQPCPSLRTLLTHPLLGGLLLLGSAVIGLGIASSQWSVPFHHLLMTVPFTNASLSYEAWIHQGLMSLFFLTLALEIRHEVSFGTLQHKKHAALPLIGAVGGMAVPALIAAFCELVLPQSPGLSGWAVPTATDAAFTVPILALVPRLPSSLRSFLMALAIFDDLGAIIIIALFYSHTVAFAWLAASLVPLSVLILLGYRRVTALTGYLLPTVLLWVGLYKAGIEPTLAGVALGFCYPPRHGQALNQALALPVGLLILPLFALTSTGVDLRQFHPSFFYSAPLLGSALGLCLGKVLGISGAVWLATRRPFLPTLPHLHGRALVGIGLVCGIGFTISLLIAQLAYTDSIPLMQSRCGVLLGSTVSALMGWAMLYRVFNRRSDG